MALIELVVDRDAVALWVRVADVTAEARRKAESLQRGTERVAIAEAVPPVDLSPASSHPAPEEASGQRVFRKANNS